MSISRPTNPLYFKSAQRSFVETQPFGATRRRGQLSVEFALLFLLSLVILGITVAAVYSMSNSFNDLAVHRKALYDINRLRMATEDVCLSGSGSSRTLILLTQLNVTTLSGVDCPVSLAPSLYSRVVIKNENGVVVISKS